MNLLSFRDLSPLRCLKPIADPHREPPKGQLYVRFGQQTFLLDVTLLDRGDGYAVETVYNGVLLLLSDLAHDKEDLSPYGYDDPWGEALRKDAEGMFHIWLSRKASGYETGVDRYFGGGDTEEAQDLVRRIIATSQAGRVREVFFSESADWRSKSGLFLALYEISVKVKVPALRQLLVSLGVSEEMLGRVDGLVQALHESRFAELSEGAAQRAELERVRVLRALLVEDLSTFCATAKMALAENRSGLYQVGRLLGRARVRPAEPAGPVPPVVGGPVVPAGPAGGRPAEPPVVPPVVAGPPMPPPAPPVAGGGRPAEPPMPPPVVARAVAAGAPALTPGAVLATLPAAGGPALSAIVQPDGGIAWVPVSGSGTVAAQPAPASPRRGRRTRGR